ncbi:MAG: transporter substrate-binding domain-containing protein [Arhodomonas sp.]|nr:transporter substrate-binding domain-containing protein [Arhodomonas sp.]
MFIIITAGLMPPVLTGEEEVLRAGVYDNPPRLFVNDAGDADGFWAELLNGIAADEDWRVEWVPVSWKEGLQRLEQGRLDIMPDVARTTAREQRLTLAEERVLTSWSRVYATAPAQLESLLDLAGRRIATLDGSVNLDGTGGIRELLHALRYRGHVGDLPRYTEAFEALADERVDAVVANKDIGNRLYRDYGAVMTPVVFQPADLVFAYPPGMPGEAGFPGRIDEHLRAMKADPESRYYALQARWLGGAQPGEGLVPSWVYWVLAALGVSVLGLIAGNLVLERRVRRHSAALHESNATLSALHDASPDMILVIGPDDRIHSANRRYHRNHRLPRGGHPGPGSLRHSRGPAPRRSAGTGQGTGRRGSSLRGGAADAQRRAPTRGGTAATSARGCQPGVGARRDPGPDAAAHHRGPTPPSSHP